MAALGPRQLAQQATFLAGFLDMGADAGLGVVVDGGRAAFVGPRGLVRTALTACTTAWRID